MKKLSILIVAIAALSMFVASVSFANVPAPPVNQTIGFDDEVFNDWTASECALCHGNNTSDRHHFLYGGAIPQGLCSATETGDPLECYQDSECVTAVAICSNYNPSRDASPYCTEDADCPRSYQHPTCTTTPYCAGTSAAAQLETSQNNDGLYGCLTCHEEETVGSNTNFIVERDCMVCHEQLPNSPSVHHLDEAVVGAKAGNCKFCHGNVVDDMDDGHVIPTYAPSNVTPEPATTDLGCSDAGYGPAIPCDDDSDCTPGSTGTCDGTPGETCDEVIIDDTILCTFGYCGGDFTNGDICTAPHNTVDPACNITADQCSGSGAACSVDADCNAAIGTCDTVVTPGDCWFTKCPDTVTDCTAPNGTADPACDVSESTCSNGGAACTVDADCNAPVGTSCSNTGDECVIDADCTVEAATCEPIKADTARAGGCNFCHDAGDDVASGVAVIDNHDTHHGTGVYKDRYGNTFPDGVDRCSWCHYQGNPHNDGGYDPIAIRTCEGCHGMESLHSIQADSPNAGNIGSIVVGFEDAGYGHIGVDDPAGDSDCTGCHGKVVDQSIFDGDVIVPPTIDTTNAITTIVANSSAQVVITGNAFTNDGPTSYTSTLKLSPIVAGNTIAISEVTVDSITATISAAPGIYTLVADKSGVESNPIALVAVAVEVTITSIKTACGDCEGTVTITGSGFGAEIPAGIQSFMSVVQDGISLSITSWTDTQIVATGGNCDGGPITVNGLFGSATK